MENIEISHSSKVLSHKTHHRWTTDEDNKLASLMQEMDELFKSIGQPNGIKRPIFWAQIPGRLGVQVTPDACAMRWRTLMDLKRAADGEVKAERTKKEETERNRRSVQAAQEATAKVLSADAISIEVRLLKAQVLELRKMILHLIKVNEQVLTNQVESQIDRAGDQVGS